LPRSRQEEDPRVYTCCALLVLLAIAIIVCLALLRRKCPRDTFPKAAVAADSWKCSEIGRDILQQGGSAVDGAIAALLCTSIMNPQSAGIGGGSIFTVMDSSGEVKIINSRETVPSQVEPDLLTSCSKQLIGSKWIGVPGEIRGYEKAHKLYGKLPWADLFQPTIELARKGFSLLTSSFRKLYSDENGNLLKTGEIVKFEKLANTLEIIAKNGADSFYSGKIAKDLIRDVQEAGGKLTLEDLASYNVTVTDAWIVPIGEYQMYTPPPPAGGFLLSLILNIMTGFQMKSPPRSDDEKTLFYHRYIEAFKFANGLKSHIRDPRFFSDKVGTTKNDRTHDPQYYNTSSYLDSLGTTHVSVLAEDGSAVSVTSTINHIFGSRIYSSSTGVILNNELADFCGRANSFSPGEQPPSSMAPVVLKSQSKILLIGASGGSMITTGLASALINHLWFGKSLKEAIASPVVFINSKNAAKFEPGFDEDVIKTLKARGHNHEPPGKFYNVVNAVEKVDGCVCAVSDKRKRGEAAGY
uniref:Gamma-glutamyltransferase 5a n=1 Tax=Nothobranchius furzeri TaxID=105023 RepID=A0A8C6LBU5_NOTFU